MQDTLVSFETAKLAKEKGFDETVLDTFSPEGIEFDRYDFEPKQYSSLKKGFETKNSILSSNFIARPTQSLLQRWLREVHKIIVLIDYSTNGYSYGLTGSIEIILSAKYEIEYFNTYEQALEKGLVKALELIKK